MQLLYRVATALGSNRQRAVLDETVGIHQILDVLPRRTTQARMPPGDRIGSRMIERQRMARQCGCKVGTNPIRVNRGGRLPHGGVGRVGLE